MSTLLAPPPISHAAPVPVSGIGSGLSSEGQAAAQLDGEGAIATHGGQTPLCESATAVTSQGPAPGLVSGESCPATVYLARLAPTGRRVQAGALTQIARLVTDGEADAWSMPWHRLTYAHTGAIRSQLAAGFAPATANRMLAALRGVLREAWRLGLMDGETYHRATDLPAVRGQRLPAGRAVTTGELAALFTACPPTPGGMRDAALIALLYGTGVRRSEAVGLDVADVDLATAAVTVRRGKGAKDRLTYLPAGALAALAAWLEVRGSAPGPLFVPVRRGGHLQHDHRLSGQAVRAILHRRAAAARVAPFGPHDLRRSTVGDMLEAGADLATVAKIAGHANVQVTMTYDRRPEATKARAASLLHVPYTPPLSVIAASTTSRRAPSRAALAEEPSRRTVGKGQEPAAA